MSKKPTFFRKNLLMWYLQNKRELPWRQTKEPYSIWLSEIILQQTRVAQGLPYYISFIEAFPSVQELASASQATVLKLWQGLGYYSRARNLHATAQFVSNELDGKFPTDYAGLLKLKGVGDYTASAIASFCYNQPTAVVDGNVYRVLARVFGIFTPINTTQGQKEFKILAQNLLDVSQPGTYNQAIMEFGAQYCVPQNPNCQACIFNENCEAFKNEWVTSLPVKLKANPVRKRYFNYLVVLSEANETILHQRKGSGIWQNLYEFPLVETTEEISLSELKKELAFTAFEKTMKIDSISLYNEDSVIHKLSHQHLYTRFWIILANAVSAKTISISAMHKLPVPVLLEKFISDFSSFKD